MKKIRFIANPRSGANRRRDLRQLIEENLDLGSYDYELCYTTHAGHAVKLAREGVETGCYMVVACGGDGSVNEISSQLLHTDCILGVLPCGSGNGFAGHLGLGRDIPAAIRALNDGIVGELDAATVNKRPFVNLAGIGFDALVARRLHRNKLRGFWGYLLSTLREVARFKMQDFEIEIDGQLLLRRCLLVEVANAPVYGYGFSIVPHARSDDGQLEVLIAKAAPLWRYVLECWRFANRSFHKSALVECHAAREVRITPRQATAIHIDGEGYRLNKGAHFVILPQALKVLHPRRKG
jgi:YegS/Rv2252/BmrU family lipid kinase